MATENLMQLFWNLSSVRDDDRLVAADGIIKKLSSQECLPDSSKLQYCLQRLVKGLASNRNGARHGYFITLTELLRVFSVPVSDVFLLIKKNLEHIGNVKAQEERGAYFGRVFAFLALLESGKLQEPSDIEHLIKSMMVVYNKKMFLQEFCAVTIGRLIQDMEEDVIFQCVVPHIGLDYGWSYCTPGKLYLMLTLHGRFPSDERLAKLLSVSWNCNELFSQENLKPMSEILLGSTLSHPHIHAVWPLIISKVRGGLLWGDFWRTVIDDSLLVSGRERKYLCYKLIESIILPSMELEEVGVVFSPKLIKQVETNAAAKQHLLHDAAIHLLGHIASQSRELADSGVSLGLAIQLQRYKSVNVFGETIKKLLSNLTVVGVVKYIKHLIKDLWADIAGPKKHAWMIQELSLLLNSVGCSMKRNREWLLILAQFLLLQSYLTVLRPIPELGAVSEPVSKAERAKYSEKLANVMSDLSSLKCKRLQSHDQVNSSCDLWPVSLVLYFEDLLKREDDVKLVHEFNKETWNNGVGVVLELNEKEEKDDGDNAFLYLLSVNLLELLKGGDKTEETVEEILTCYGERILLSKKTPGRRKSRAPVAASSDWLTVLMDLLLGLLSYHNQFWRNVTERVFLWLKGSLTAEVIQVIIKTIEPQQLEEVMEREESDEQGLQEEMDGNADGDGKEEDEDDPDIDKGYDEDVVSQGVFCDIGAEFRANVRNALGDLAAVDSDQESITSLDDEEMEVLDSALAAVFHEQKEKALAKKQKKNDKITLMHFKMRVLDLIGVYIRYQSTNPLMLEFLSPLLMLSIKYHSHKTFSPLSEKSRSILDKLCRVKSYPREGVDVDKVHLLLKELITKRLYKAQRMAPVVTQCSMFLLRVLRGGVSHKHPAISPMVTRSLARKRKNHEKAENQPSTTGSLCTDDVVEWCTGVLNDAITDKNCNVPASFFVTLSERQPEISWRLLPTLTNSLKCASNHFRKIQGYNILRAMLGNFALLSEESVVSFLSPVINNLSDIIAQELLSQEDTSSKMSHYLVMMEAFGDIIVTAQAYGDMERLINYNLVSKVVKHLSSSNNQKVLEIIGSIRDSLSDNEPVNRSPSKKTKSYPEEHI